MTAGAEVIGRVHAFQSLGTVDGPGVRCVVFLSGCPLHCGYCHNPDTWDAAGGEPLSAETVVRRALRYKPYFGAQGGVTVSGGEALMQAEFVTALFTRLKAEGVHTCLDTSGCRLDAPVRALLAVTDLVLLDIKMNTDAAYREHVGMSLAQPLRFLDELERRGVDTWIRQVVVEGIHDAPGQMALLRELIRPYRCIRKVELLPFRKLCLEKYREMGKPFPFERYPETSQQTISRLERELSSPA